MTIQERAKELIKIRMEMFSAKIALDQMKLIKDTLTAQIIADMTKAGFKSIKTDDAMISRQVAKSLTIVDEDKLIADFKKKGLKDYVKEQINRDLWRPFATEAIKQNMKFPGTELRETEFISIRNVKK